MKAFSKPIAIKCKQCRRGVMVRIHLSRIEEGLGHEGFQCDVCGEKAKYVPKGAE